MNKLRWTLAIAAVAGLFLLPKAWADLSVKDGSNASQTIFNFVCFTSKLCNATTLINSAGTEIGTSSNPVQVTVANTGANSTAVKVNVASGGIASGAIASGAIASGALASGSVASGAMVDLGAQADSVCGTATGTCSLISLVKYNNSVSPALTQGGSALSTTNGIYSNLLQGNAVLSATNPIFSRPTDGTNAQVTDPCQAVAKSNFTGSQTSGTQVITGTSAKKTYICSMHLIVQGADVVNIIAGTGSVCATGSSAVMGSTTAANGMSYAANGGFTLGNGQGTVIAATAANADNVCITQSGSSRITYQGTYVQL